MNKEKKQILKNQSAIMNILFHGQISSFCRDEIVRETNNTSEASTPIMKINPPL